MREENGERAGSKQGVSKKMWNWLQLKPKPYGMLPTVKSRVIILEYFLPLGAYVLLGVFIALFAENDLIKHTPYKEVIALYCAIFPPNLMPDIRTAWYGSPIRGVIALLSAIMWLLAPLVTAQLTYYLVHRVGFKNLIGFSEKYKIALFLIIMPLFLYGFLSWHNNPEVMPGPRTYVMSNYRLGLATHGPGCFAGFVFFASGWAAIFIAVCIAIIDKVFTVKSNTDS